ncbi:MAG TPA: type II/IV secretion system ATPase subunit [Acidobacteriota bacterium]|nr:type II/IV secretion system ATPase subunit [Acidobacteriota bacterium]
MVFLTKVDTIFDTVQEEKKSLCGDLAKKADMPVGSVVRIARYLEQLGLVEVDRNNILGTSIKFIKTPEPLFLDIDESEIINKLKFYKSFQNIQAANKLIYDIYNYLQHRDDSDMKKIYVEARKYYMDNFIKDVDKTIKDPITKIDSHTIEVDSIIVDVEIIKQELEPVPFYVASLLRVSDVTRLVIDKIKEEVIGSITFNLVFKTHEEENLVKQEYKQKILKVMGEVFPDLDEKHIHAFSDYVVITSLGMGDVEFLLRDKYLEEIVINNAFEPIWVYHKKYGWLETNIILDDEAEIVHYATLAGRNVDKMITTLTPLMDSNLKSGDRVNATLNPISSKGNTITIRKFAEAPWSITDFLMTGTIDYYTAALVWTAMQYELSILIVGGTGSGKTSTLNVFSLFIPPNQRVVSIEDTRELRLPRTLHWVPMETRLPNPEGKGEISMLDLIVNSLRMRPDRILVGEIRRKKEAEVLFEAMHTGHSVYATLHANSVSEAIVRLTTEPIGISKSQLNAVDLLFVQNRNRRTNTRRTFQIAEVLDDGEYNLLFNYSFKSDKLEAVKKPVEFYKTIELFAGLSKLEVDKEIAEKMRILKYFVQKKITNVEELALLINYYYVNKKYLMKKLFGEQPLKTTTAS